MRWLITGANGMVGSALATRLEREGETAILAPRSALDIGSRSAVLDIIGKSGPDVIVNCAAFTKVDDCESREEEATRVNGTAVGHLADAANGALLIQISTDFVFDGAKRTPYVEEDPVAPLSAYGRSKLAGEVEAARAREHLIVRTSWVFGAGGANFVHAIRKQVDAGREELRVVNDQRGRPTYAPHLAGAIVRLVRAKARGLVHYADRPDCTWYDFAVAIVHELQRKVRVVPVSTADVPRPATRPAYSVLSTERYERLTGASPASWQEGLVDSLVGKGGNPAM